MTSGLPAPDDPSWSGVEHSQSDVNLVLSVADAIELKALLPHLQAVITGTSARDPATRAARRSADTVLHVLQQQLEAALVAYDRPAAFAPTRTDHTPEAHGAAASPPATEQRP